VADTTRASLLARIRGGDEVAWGEFAARYRPLLLWAAGRCGAAGADAEDVAQEVMLDLFKGSQTFRYDRARGRFRDYLFVIARRKAAQVRARRDRAGSTGSDLPEPAADDELRAGWEAEWQRVVFRDALDAVKMEVEPKTFRAFEAYELEGRDVAAVAAELGVAPASVYVYKTRVVRRLRALVEELADR
jgi:RNA polymerase sigma factor (sigma-70 family)